MAGRELPSSSTDCPRASKSNGGVRLSSGCMARAEARRRSMVSGEIVSAVCLEDGIRVVDTTEASDCDDEVDISASSATSTDNDDDYWQTPDEESGQLSEIPSDNTQMQEIMDMLEMEGGIYLKSRESALQCPSAHSECSSAHVGHGAMWSCIIRRTTISAHQGGSSLGHSLLSTMAIS